MSQKIAFTKNLFPKPKPADETQLQFGRIFTDHMFVMDYLEGEGWLNPRIVPYGPLLLDPSAMVLHYGQAIFEGMKAYRGRDGRIRLFRPELNFARANRSNERMGIPQIDEEFCLEALEALLRVDADWIPSSPGTSLYIRPFIIATDPFLGVRASHRYQFLMILSPSGSYYAGGINPVSIYIEDEYVRAVRGGTGQAKTPGNYAASILAQEQAHERGFSQVLWLDGVEKTYIEEVGSMNVMFVRKGEVYTPALNGSILPGITRRSVIELLKDWGITVHECRIAANELIEWARRGEVDEAFGTGTAAVISPIGKLFFEGEELLFNEGKIGALSQRLYDEICDLQYGKIEDRFHWTRCID